MYKRQVGLGRVNKFSNLAGNVGSGQEVFSGWFGSAHGPLRRRSEGCQIYCSNEFHEKKVPAVPSDFTCIIQGTHITTAVCTHDVLYLCRSFLYSYLYTTSREEESGMYVLVCILGALHAIWTHPPAEDFIKN